MARFTDLSGAVFGRLTVLERDIEKQKQMNSNRTYWKCKCECGNIVSIVRNHLISGHTTSCGCKKYKQRAVDLTGQKFNYLTVKKRSDKTNQYGKVYWICECECGKLTEVETSELKSGHTKSCGCKKGKQKIQDLTGQKFNKLTVIKLSDSKQAGHLMWICKCDCGNYCEVTGNHLKDGHTASCGCINKSLGEEHIEQVLIENNIKYLRDKNYFKDLILTSGYNGRYDFILFNDNDEPYYLIEFDGLQHSKEWTLKGSSLLERQKNDKIKNNYAKNHNLPLCRIPYSKRDNITLDLLFDKRYLV